MSAYSSESPEIVVDVRSQEGIRRDDFVKALQLPKKLEGIQKHFDGTASRGAFGG
jgi:hypothetical protein